MASSPRGAVRREISRQTLVMLPYDFENILPYGVIHLVCMQNFQRKYHFWHPETQPYVCVTGGKKC